MLADALGLDERAMLLVSAESRSVLARLPSLLVHAPRHTEHPEGGDSAAGRFTVRAPRVSVFL